MEITKEHLKDSFIAENLKQIKIIEDKLESNRLETSRLKVAHTVFKNSLIQYMKDIPT